MFFRSRVRESGSCGLVVTAVKRSVMAIAVTTVAPETLHTIYICMQLIQHCITVCAMDDRTHLIQDLPVATKSSIAPVSAISAVTSVNLELNQCQSNCQMQQFK